MRHRRHPNLLPAILLSGLTAALAVEALQPRAGLAIYAVLLPGRPVTGPEAQDPAAPDWRIRRVVAVWPLTILLLDRPPGSPPSGTTGLRAMLGAALLVSLPTGADCAQPAE
jgi:hypothetical protein